MKTAFLLSVLLGLSSSCYASFVYTCKGMDGTLTVDPESGTVEAYQYNFGNTFKPTLASDWKSVPGGEGRLLAIEGMGGSSLMRVPKAAFQGASSFTLYAMNNSIHSGHSTYRKTCRLK